MIEDILKNTKLNAENRAMGDIERTNHCAGTVSGEVRIFRFLGIEYDFGTYKDDEYEMIGYLYVDGVVLVKNGKIDWKAYGNAVFDKEHAWGMRQLGVESVA